MLPSQLEFENILRRLREEQTESSTVDGKADLPLETEGDRAYFIRHAAALANNVERSYLIIGVENRTWNPIGLPDPSPLRDPDATQQRMNQVLAKRTDPNLSIRYRTYQADETVYGLVAIEGTSAPYIIAIDDHEYGGDRTQAAQSYIYPGAIYVRRGANSVIANRQSEVLDIVTKVQQLATANAQPDEFLANYNYLDVESKDFGRHSLTDRLVEVHIPTNSYETDFQPAQSWVSFVFCPLDSGCEINTISLKERLTASDQRIFWGGEEPYRWVPKHTIQMFYNAHATPRELLGTWSPLRPNAEEIALFVRICPSGHIEIGGTNYLFIPSDGGRWFAFVNLIGYLWQMVYFTRAIHSDANFYGETKILLNLIGTKGTRLAEFAKGWMSPFSPMYPHSAQDVCQYLNVQLEQRLALAASSDDEIETAIRGIAGELGAYYGQERPRCFDYDTDEFPWTSYWDHFGS